MVTVAGIVGVVAAIIFFLILVGIAKVGKENMPRALGITGVVALVFLLGLTGVFSGVPALDNFMKTPLTAAPTQQPPPPPGAVCGNNACETGETQTNCPQDCGTPGLTVIPADSQDLIVYLHDYYNPGTELTQDYIHIWQNDNGQWVDKGYYSSGGTVKTAPGKQLWISPAENSSNFYGKLVKHTVSDQGSDSIDFKVPGNATSSDMTFSVNNVDGSVNDGDTPQAIGADQIKTLSWRIDGAVDKDFSAGKVGFVCEFNSTAYNDVSFKSDAGNIIETSGIKPQDMSIAASDAYREFELASPIVEQQVLQGTASWEASSKNPPKQNATCILLEQDVFVNGDTGLPEIGYEDDNRNYVGHQNVRAVNITFSFS